MNVATHAERAAPVLYCRAAVVDETVSDDSRSVDVIVSTDAIDGHGTIVKQNWKLERFASNPVVLYAHDHWDLPIGRASDVGVVDGQLRAKITFSTEDLNPKAEQIWRNVKAKVIRGISAGFMPHSVTFEKQNDRDLMVLDDNELFEISVTPCPSNADALMQMRSMHAPQQQTPPALDAGEKATPIEEERPVMSEKKDKDNDMDTGTNIAVARALQLPIGSTDHDVLTRVAQLRELESQAIAITGVKSAAEAVGAIRANKEAADRLAATEEKLAKVEAERDVQNFDTLVNQALAERKMTPAEAKQKRDEFEQDVKDGRGAIAVERLRGWVKVAAPRLGDAKRQLPAGTASRDALVWQGKPYADLKPAQRAVLAKEEPELYRAMKTDHEANASA